MSSKSELILKKLESDIEIRSNSTISEYEKISTENYKKICEELKTYDITELFSLNNLEFMSPNLLIVNKDGLYYLKREYKENKNAYLKHLELVKHINSYKKNVGFFVELINFYEPQSHAVCIWISHESKKIDFFNPSYNPSTSDFYIFEFFKYYFPEYTYFSQIERKRDQAVQVSTFTNFDYFCLSYCFLYLKLRSRGLNDNEAVKKIQTWTKKEKVNEAFKIWDSLSVENISDSN